MPQHHRNLIPRPPTRRAATRCAHARGVLPPCTLCARMQAGRHWASAPDGKGRLRTYTWCLGCAGDRGARALAAVCHGASPRDAAPRPRVVPRVQSMSQHAGSSGRGPRGVAPSAPDRKIIVPTKAICPNQVCAGIALGREGGWMAWRWRPGRPKRRPGMTRATFEQNACDLGRTQDQTTRPTFAEFVGRRARTFPPGPQDLSKRSRIANATWAVCTLIRQADTRRK